MLEKTQREEKRLRSRCRENNLCLHRAWGLNCVNWNIRHDLTQQRKPSALSYTHNKNNNKNLCLDLYGKNYCINHVKALRMFYDKNFIIKLSDKNHITF